MADKVSGVILASDVDERMDQFKINIPRGMLEVGGKPILQHQIELMKGVGVKDFVFMVSFKKELIEEYFGDGKKLDVNIRYVEQKKSLGIAHAVGQLEKYCDSPFILSLSSIFLLAKDFRQLIELAEHRNAPVSLAVQNSSDPNFSEFHFGVILHPDNRVKRIAEKPRYIMSNLKGCGIYYFDPVIFDAIRRTPRTAMRDLYEITDSVQILIDDGFPVYYAEVIEWYKHINSLKDLEICREKYASIQ